MERCSRDEARDVFSRRIRTATPEVLAKLRTLTDEELARLCDSNDLFALVESNRRLSSSLQREAARTMWLTVGVVVLTVGLVILTFRLVRLEDQRAAAVPAPPANAVSLPESGHRGGIL